MLRGSVFFARLGAERVQGGFKVTHKEQFIVPGNEPKPFQFPDPAF